MLTTLFAFAATIVVIVAIHEYGHYLAMRIFNVKVLTFSIGFGPKLLRWRSGKGTDFVISAIPLGGYVKPLDRRDCDIFPEEESGEFSQKPAWQRVIVYAAGPFANFVLAVALYWFIFIGGQYTMPAIVGDVQPDMPAAEAGFEQGDEIVGLGKKEVSSWQQINTGLLRFVGEVEPVMVSLKKPNGDVVDTHIDLSAWAKDPEQPVLDVLGMEAKPLPAVVGEVLADGAAEKAGLQAGDKVLTVDGQTIEGWSQWVEVVQKSPEQTLQVEVQREDKKHTIELTPKSKELDGERIGLAGVQLGGLKKIDYTMVSAVPASVERTYDQVTMILSSFKKMLLGHLSVKSLGGPITIAQAAGETAAIGMDSFLLFLAFFSISLGVINLLPIPMLDGGWIMFGTIEMIMRKPLSDDFLMAAQRVGMALVLALMSIAIVNDLMRQFT